MTATQIPFLTFDQIDEIVTGVAQLGIEFRAQYGTRDRSTDVFIAGPNRYLLVRDDTIVHTSEFALRGVLVDPSGHNEACTPAGHRVYIDVGLSAMLTTPRTSGVDIPGFGGRWAVSPFRATTPDLAAWLGTDMRPFTEGLALHVERPLRVGLDGSGPVGGPVVVARHDTPPEDWPHLPWHRRGDPAPLPEGHARPTRRGYPGRPDTFVPTTCNDVIDRWRVARSHGSPRGYVGLIARAASHALDHVVLIGREGDQLVERQRGVTATNAAVTVYDDPTRPDTEWQHAADVLRRLGPTEVARRFPRIPERTRRYMTAGRPPTAHTRTLVTDALRIEAIRAHAAAHRLVPDGLCALLAGYAQLLDEQVHASCEACGSRLAGRQARWCANRCRKQAERDIARTDQPPRRSA